MGAIATDERPAATSPIKSIQRGEVEFGFSFVAATQTVNISSVDMAKSVVNLLASLGVSHGTGSAVLSLHLSSSTQLTFKQRGPAGTSATAIDRTVSYEVIEYV